MKTTRYKFEQAVQEVKTDTTEWLKEEFKSILESDKDFTRKADYIGFSIASIDDKVASLDEEIKELQQLKKRLKSAKNIALTTGAKVLKEYGIEKLEGAGISSITLTPSKTKEIQQLKIIDESELIKRGYYTIVIDEAAIVKDLETEDGKSELLGVASLSIEEVYTEGKLKINKRRSKANNEINQLENAS